MAEEIPEECLECKSMHKVLQFELEVAAMFQTALLNIIESDEPIGSYARETAAYVLAAYAVKNNQRNKENGVPRVP